MVNSVDVAATGKPRLIFLNRCYWPDTEATGQLLADLCEGLVPDFEVHVVCGQPNSPETQDYQPHGIQVRRGVVIHRLSHTRFPKRVPAGRVLNLISFSRSCERYLQHEELDAEIVISETDPFLLPLVAARHARRVGSKLVCYLQDVYPDVAEAIGRVRPGWFTGQIRERLRTAYRAADRIVVLGDCMRHRLSTSPWGLDPTKFNVIPNWADCQSIAPRDTHANELRRREGLDDRFVVMHSGNMGLTQRLDVLIDATRSTSWPENATLLLVGDGAARNELRVRAEKIGNQRVRFLPYQPRGELALSLAAADLHVVSMHERIIGCLCPSKLYGILAAGRPVLAIAPPETDLYQTVERHQLGWCCVPGDGEAIARAILRAAENPAQCSQAAGNARELALQAFDRPVVLKRFRRMFKELIGSSEL
jgi:glycosyltransferase involved in cell wall biosynthesis